MQFDASAAERARAKNPHELFVINLAVFHLLLAPAAIALGVGWWGLLLPLTLSGSVIGFIRWRGWRAEAADPWFVMAHWKLAWARCRWLLIAYGASGLILLAGWLVSLGAQGTMKDIVLTIFTRFGVMPVLLTVMVTFVIESGSIHQAGKGEVPDRLVEKYPQPQGSPVWQQDENASAR